MKRHPKHCIVAGCKRPIEFVGKCAEHYQEDVQRAKRRKEALTALHTSAIDNRVPENPELREELSRLRKWFDDAARVVQRRIANDTVPLDEADAAIEWCIRLATEIVEAERRFRQGDAAQYELDATRDWVWERFRCLAAGLQSNGLPRAAK